MATNDFLQFGAGVGSNVSSQTSWAANASRGSGFQAGTASSADANKAWRQSLAMTCAWGTICNNAGFDSLDDGNIANLVTSILASLRQSFRGQTFNIPVTSTFTVPAGVTRIKYRIWGAGGGGGGCNGSPAGSGSGAGGGYIEGVASVTPAQTISITVGGGGAGGSGTPSSGTLGGTSSFGTIATASGGNGGQTASGGFATAIAAAGSGGGTSGALSLAGQSGSASSGNSSAPLAGGGAGALGGAGGLTGCINGPGSPGIVPGGGGSGTTCTTGGQPGGNGANGLIILEW